MIAQFNRIQRLKGVASLVGSGLALLLTIAFFYLGARIALYNLKIEDGRGYAIYFTLVATALVFICGWTRGRSGRGHYGFEDSEIFVNLEPVSGGAVMTQLAAQRLTVPAYLLGQCFLAAPLLLHRSLHCFRSRIPREHGLEEKLRLLLGEIRAVGKWHSFESYPDRRRELTFLVRLGEVEFSARKGRVRATSATP